MAVRTSDAEWKGNLREGAGRVEAGQRGVRGKLLVPPALRGRQGDQSRGLLGASHAACYSMASSAADAPRGASTKPATTTAASALGDASRRRRAPSQSPARRSAARSRISFGMSSRREMKSHPRSSMIATEITLKAVLKG